MNLSEARPSGPQTAHSHNDGAGGSLVGRTTSDDPAGASDRVEIGHHSAHTSPLSRLMGEPTTAERLAGGKELAAAGDRRSYGGLDRHGISSEEFFSSRQAAGDGRPIIVADASGVRSGTSDIMDGMVLASTKPLPGGMLDPNTGEPFSQMAIDRYLESLDAPRVIDPMNPSNSQYPVPMRPATPARPTPPPEAPPAPATSTTSFVNRDGDRVSVTDNGDGSTTNTLSRRDGSTFSVTNDADGSVTTVESRPDTSAANGPRTNEVTTTDADGDVRVSTSVTTPTGMTIEVREPATPAETSVARPATVSRRDDGDGWDGSADTGGGDYDPGGAATDASTEETSGYAG